MKTVYNVENYLIYGARLQSIYNGKCSLNCGGIMLILPKFLISMACGKM